MHLKDLFQEIAFTVFVVPIEWVQCTLQSMVNETLGHQMLKNPLFYGFLALFLSEAVEAMDVTFNQIQGS